MANFVHPNRNCNVSKTLQICRRCLPEHEMTLESPIQSVALTTFYCDFVSIAVIHMRDTWTMAWSPLFRQSCEFVLLVLAGCVIHQTRVTENQLQCAWMIENFNKTIPELALSLNRWEMEVLFPNCKFVTCEDYCNDCHRNTLGIHSSSNSAWIALTILRSFTKYCRFASSASDRRKIYLFAEKRVASLPNVPASLFLLTSWTM